MTGQPLLRELLDRNHDVRVIVRSPHKIPADLRDRPGLSVVEANVLDLSDEQMFLQVQGCDAVVSCLGHTVDFTGLFREPKRLCTDATRRLCEAIERNAPLHPVKYILMNTVGVGNPDLAERRTRFERSVLFLLRHTLPPHRDNETAAELLHRRIGKENRHIEWCIVRPDTLINAEVSPYGLAESPSTGIFSGRPTTRSNVAHVMAELLEKEELWEEWKFRMPVIMNAE